MNKKGLLFTIFSFLFLSSLLFIVLAYSAWFTNFVSVLGPELSAGTKVAFVEEDIFYDLVSLYSIEDINIEREGPNVTLKVDNFFNSSRDYVSLLSSYETFIEGNYATETNTEIVVEDLSYGFLISPYGLHTSNQANSLYVFTDEYEKIKEINITILIYDTVTHTTTTTPSNSGDTIVRVKTLSSSGTEFLDSHASLSGTTSNAPFETRFATNLDIDVYYEDTGTESGVLWIDYSQEIVVQSLEITYTDLDQSIRLEFNGTVAIDPHVGTLEKTSRVGIEG
jgi:hypothetical protein